ncbi:MAG: hypothetical protein GY822_30770 [Deltaproteobacteria bacterium]|nr:hypothetical protein [Deltaproteobacteria bacterium]
MCFFWNPAISFLVVAACCIAGVAACSSGEDEENGEGFTPAVCSAFERCGDLTSENEPGSLNVVPVVFGDRPRAECDGCFLAVAQVMYKTWNTTRAEMNTVLRRGYLLERVVGEVWTVDLDNNDDAAVFCAVANDDCHCVGFEVQEHEPVNVLLGPLDPGSNQVVIHGGSAPPIDDVNVPCPSLAQ